MRYADIDRLLYWMVDRRRTHEQLVAMGFAGRHIERVERLVAGSEFKRQVAADRQARPRARPASTTSIRAAGRAQRRRD